MEAQRTGIGTLSPTNTLSVVGNAHISDSLSIGTTVPSKRLTVNGDALIHGITIGRGGNGLPFNTAFGNNALPAITTGYQNTAAGYVSLSANSTGNDNVAVGNYTLTAISSGSGNVAVGHGSQPSSITGSYNTTIGAYSSLGSNALTNASAIGADAVVSSSNSLVLGYNANVGIGINAPETRLHVNGKIKTTSLQITQNPTDGYVLKSDAQGVGAWTNIASLETDPQVGTNTINKIPRWNGTSLVSGIIYDNGSIGINTTNPGAKLDIIGSGNGLRLWSGGNASTDHTSIQLGRTSTDASLGVASSAGHYSADASAGDLILRTELSGGKVILNSGSGQANLVATQSRVGIGTTSPANALDVEGNMVVGSSYSGSATGPANGMLIEGTLGVGTTTPNLAGKLHISSPNSKTNTETYNISSITTNEPLVENPFGLSFSITGASSIENRNVSLQTMEDPSQPPGPIIIQGTGGSVGIGTTTPEVALDVQGGIRSKYSGSHVIDLDQDNPLNYYTHFLELDPAPPAGWNSTNTIVLISVADGAPVVLCGAFYNAGGVIVLTTRGIANGLTRINYILFRHP